MINRILTIGAAVAAAVAGISLAQAQQGYPPPGAVYSAQPPYPPGGYVVDERRRPGVPDFDALDDEDDAPGGPQATTALPPPGPIGSPSDPRYANRPVYPTGPILSPDGPRR